VWKAPEGFRRAVLVLALQAGEVVLPLRYGASITFAPMALTLTLAAEAGDDLGHPPGIPNVSSSYDFVDRRVDAH
jgi:hypothetical protein